MFLSACLGLGFTIGGTVDAEPPGESSVEQCHDDECDAHEVDQSAPELILGDDGNPGGSDGDPRGGDNDRGGIEVEADPTAHSRVNHQPMPRRKSRCIASRRHWKCE